MALNILVTGASGFIGSHLCENLIKEGHQVTGLDDLSTGRLSNIEAFRKQMQFVEGSITDAKLLKEILTPRQGKKFDAIFHVAAVPSVVRSIENPEASHVANIDGTFNVLMAARDCGVRRVVYSASSSAYGQQTGEYKVETLPAQPISPYALQKWVGEKYCEYFTEFYGVETVALRYFNVFGPRQNPNSVYAAVIPKFIECILKGQPVPIHGDGKQGRDFTYVANVVQGNIKALHAPKEACGKVYNLAMGQSTDLVTLISMIEKLTGLKAERQHSESRAGDIRYSKAAIAKAEQHLGYRPGVTLEEGLAHTIEFIKNNEVV